MADAATMTDSQIIQIDGLDPDPSVVAHTVELLNNGGLVVAPTETRYGLIAGIHESQAVEKLFEAKGREKGKPSAIFVLSISELEELAEMNTVAKKLAELFLPGPLTLVLKSKRKFGPFFTQNGLTGFRISSSPVISSILDKCRFPISATSANISGEKEPETVREIEERFGETIDLYLDAGRLNKPTSTVVQIVDNELKILRAGAISESKIREVLK